MKVITKMDSIPSYAEDVVEILKERALHSGLKIWKVFNDTLPDGEPGVMYTHLILQGSRLGFVKYFGKDLMTKGYCRDKRRIYQTIKTDVSMKKAKESKTWTLSVFFFELVRILCVSCLSSYRREYLCHLDF